MSEPAIPQHRDEDHAPKVLGEPMPHGISVNKNDFDPDTLTVMPDDTITFKLNGGRTLAAEITVTALTKGSNAAALFTDEESPIVSGSPVTRKVASSAAGNYQITTSRQPDLEGDPMTGTIRVGSNSGGDR